MRIINGRWDKIKSEYIVIFVCGIVTVLCIGFLIYWIALDRVTLTVDGQQYQYRTLSSTVGQVLEERQVSLKAGDQVIPGLKSPVAEDLKIEIIRSFPVRISVAGKATEFYTICRPVREVLALAKIPYDQDDRIVPELNSLVQPNQKVRVINVTSKVETRMVTINPATEYRKDKKLERGDQKVIREGKPGQAERQVKVIYEDGRPVKRLTLAEKVLKPAINGIIVLGTKPVVRTLVTSRGSYRYTEVKVMNSTAYYPGPESTGKYAVYGQTYTGKKAGFGLVAVDPRVIKLGTKLYIEGYGYAEAADIGGAIKGNDIDLCFETYREAVMYGRKMIKVYILE